MEKKKKAVIPYTVFFIGLILILCLAGLGIYQYYLLHQKNLDYQKQLEEITEAVDFVRSLSADGSEESIALSVYNSEVSADIGNIISVMQVQYDSFTQNASFLLTMISIFVTIFVVAMPIMNYLFFTKDMVKALQAENSKLEDKVNNELDRLGKTIKQTQEVISSLVSDDKNKSESIEPISESADDKAHSFYLNALMAFNRKDYTPALKHINYAIELKNTSQYLLLRADIYAEQKEFEKAIADYSSALKLNPEDSNLYFNRGYTYDELKDYDKAIADYNKAIELNPDGSEAYNNRGIVYRTLKDYDKAIADYNKAIELNPDYSIAYNNRGYAYAKSGELDKALSDCNKAINLDADNAHNHDTRGFAYFLQGEYESALSDYNRSIEIDSTLAEPRVYRSKTYLAMGNIEAATEDYEIAKTMDIDDEDLQNDLNKLKEELDNRIEDMPEMMMFKG